MKNLSNSKVVSQLKADLNNQYLSHRRELPILKKKKQINSVKSRYGITEILKKGDDALRKSLEKDIQIPCPKKSFFSASKGRDLQTSFDSAFRVYKQDLNKDLKQSLLKNKPQMSSESMLLPQSKTIIIPIYN